MNKNISANTQPRPPVVVVMGHIDHGKSKLLDYIRKTSVVEKEAGGITQHIGAYEVEVKNKRITFLDTPGHEAFSNMRARGAKVADVAILVIAADEGVKPQTLEAHEAIKKTGIPFAVALNKIDKPEANLEQVKAQLAENQIFVENYGGKVPAVNISAKTGEGVNELLDIILLLAEMENLSANPGENASGAVIESHLDPKRGISAALLIQNGAMKKGMFVASGNAMAPVRIFEDFQGKSLEEATFSSPVKIVGFDRLPEVGSEFKTFETKKEAREYARRYEIGFSGAKPGFVAEIDREKIFLPVIIKADASGSVEALEKEIMKLQNEEMMIKILRRDVGNINEDDINLGSSAQNAVVLGFNVRVDPSARELAEKFNVIIQTSDIIYKVSEWLEEEIKKRKLAAPGEKITGKAEILKLFSRTKNKQLAGGRVSEGKITIGASVRIKKDEAEIGQGKIIGLRQNKMETREIEVGKEFGAMIESKTEIAKGDLIEIVKKTG